MVQGNVLQSRRASLRELMERFRLTTDNPFSDEVTIISITRTLSEVEAGTLYIPVREDISLGQLYRAVKQGAYAFLLPSESDVSTAELGVPVLHSMDIDKKVGEIASWMNDSPSEHVATFLLMDEKDSSHLAFTLARLLHMLGNPVGVLNGRAASFSALGNMDFAHPFDAVHCEKALAIMVEDGVRGVVICVNKDTLQKDALCGLLVDVCIRDFNSEKEDIAPTDEKEAYFGIKYDLQTHFADLSKASIPSHLEKIVSPYDTAMRSAIFILLSAGIDPYAIEEALRVGENLAQIYATKELLHERKEKM